MEGVALEWTPVANFTRRPLHLGPHRVASQLSVHTPEYVLTIFSVGFVPVDFDEGHVFHFIDLAFARRVHQDGECLEGVWGRTTCHSSLDKIDPDDYDMNGDLLGVAFPHNLFL
jgi:hypothetical protein